MAENQTKRKPKPKWLKRKLPTDPNYQHVHALLKKNKLNTVCQEANCPNIFECFSKRTSTFLIMGPNCTRNCKYCSVTPGPSGPPDPEEPKKVADAAKKLDLNYVVVTSVTRDDLHDGGADHFSRTIREVQRALLDAKVEVLIPDFQGNEAALKTVLEARPDVLNHNIETVERLFPVVRPLGNYRQSIELLQASRRIAPDIPTKSGIMIGLGETDDEIDKALKDLQSAGCEIVTIGQYLKPVKDGYPVDRYYTPEEFDNWKEKARKIGIPQVASGPFVRSSYEAKALFAY
jgi:lipoic acid synthetase